MKINQVEQLVGITKRNIRFYEKEGLLAPGRNLENGYRDYDDEDVEVLRKIKLLRKLAMPLEEIRSIQAGTLTLADGVRRHIIQLERERENLSTMQEVCHRLGESGQTLQGLPAEQWLQDMAALEQKGAKFVNIKKQDTITRYAGPVVAALVFIGMMAWVIGMFVWAVRYDPQGMPPLGIMLFMFAVPVVVIIGVVLALVQRIKQIKGGEEDAASQY